MREEKTRKDAEYHENGKTADLRESKVGNVKLSNYPDISLGETFHSDMQTSEPCTYRIVESHPLSEGAPAGGLEGDPEGGPDNFQTILFEIITLESTKAEPSRYSKAKVQISSYLMYSMCSLI